MRARATALVTALVAALGLTACGGDTVSGYAAGGGAVRASSTVEQIPAAERTTTITVRGTTVDGAVIDTSTYRGQVVVLNTWGTWCGPCNAEAPALQKAWTGLQPDGVRFVGVNVRDDDAAVSAFERRFGITYPSVRWDGGAVTLQLQGKAVNTPTTIVLDRQGRVAARVLEKVDATLLTGLVQDVAKDPA